MIQDFAGRTVLVTGATSGIGRAAVIELASRGASVVAAARREREGLEVVEMANAAGLSVDGRAQFVATDVTDGNSIDALFERIETDIGRLDGAFNNAGIEADAAMTPDMSVEVFDRLFATNVRGTWLCMRHELGIMRKQEHGAIVNTSSIAGVIGFPQASAYTASKHAVVGMTKSAGLELAEFGIRVNCLCPGATKSEMSDRWVSRYPGGEAEMVEMLPMKRLGTPEQLAAAAIFMLSDAAAYMTGHAMVVDGGFSVK